jgi:hypothetical protein
MEYLICLSCLTSCHIIFLRICLMNTYIFAYVLEETLHLMVNTFCPHYALVTLTDIVHHYQKEVFVQD